MRASLVSKVFVFLMTALLALATTGCAASNREAHMRERAGEFVYARPMQDVWAAALKLLQEEGYSGREVKGGWMYVTEWKEGGGGSNVSSTFTRYLLEGKEHGPARSTVKFTQMTRSVGSPGAGFGGTDGSTHAGMSSMGMAGGSDPKASGPPQSASEGLGQRAAIASGTRDLGMEWKLLQRLEPAKAGAIETEATQLYP